jgi:hypothetical protein
VAIRKSVIRNRPRTEAENLDEAVPVFTEGASKGPLNDYKRGNDTSVRGEEIKSISVGIEDIDQAVMYYFQEVIKPYVINEGTTYSVPVVYADPERWKSAQRDGGVRDKEGKILFPVITIKKENMEKNRNITNKLDGNRSNVYQVFEKRYSRKNQYDNFSVLTNRAPIKEFYNVVVPDYYTITYSCAIYVSFMSDLNKLIESIGYRSDAYWGLPNKFLFKAEINNFPITSQITDGEDRKIISTFTLSLRGYLTPDNIDKFLSSEALKSINKTHLIFTMEAVSGDLETFQVSTKKQASVAATSFVPEGVNVVNNNYTITTVGDAIVTYLNTNKSLKADYSTENTAYFISASFLPAPVSSSLPETSVVDFRFFVNGVYVPQEHLISFSTSGSGLLLTVNTGSLGYGFDNQDEVIGVGKFA